MFFSFINLEYCEIFDLHPIYSLTHVHFLLPPAGWFFYNFLSKDLVVFRWNFMQYSREGLFYSKVNKEHGSCPRTLRWVHQRRYSIDIQLWFLCFNDNSQPLVLRVIFYLLEIFQMCCGERKTCTLETLHAHWETSFQLQIAMGLRIIKIVSSKIWTRCEIKPPL